MNYHIVVLLAHAELRSSGLVRVRAVSEWATTRAQSRFKQMLRLS